MDESKKKVFEQAKKDNVKFINLQFSDMMGAAKNVTIPVEQLEDSLERGSWFDGSSIEGFTRIHESDMFLMPDPETYAIIPWMEGEQKSARLICDVHMPDGSPFEGDPRYILKKTLKEAEDMGYEFKTGPELEFFLFKKDEEKVTVLPHDKGGYFDLTMDEAYEVRKEMIVTLEKLGIEVEASHHEVAVGQHEIDFKYNGALRTADKAMTLRFALKAIAQKHGLHCTFMPKPISGVNGSGMHVHQSLFDKETGKNAFYDEKDKYHLSKLAYSFVAGQLKHIREVVALTNPLVNSYKRLVPGYEAATYICWAQVNRSALIRIPRYSPGREQSTRCEIRCPDPSANPYLAFAGLLKIGLEGIKKEMTPPDAVNEDVFEFDDKMLADKKIEYLPYSLWQAIKELRDSELIRGLLGEHTHSRYVAAKTEEWDSFRTSVTDWEIDRYMETV